MWWEQESGISWLPWLLHHALDTICHDAQAADQEAEVRSLHCQLATLADDSETALLRAAQADSRAAESLREAEQLRQAVSLADTTAQVWISAM